MKKTIIICIGAIIAVIAAAIVLTVCLGNNDVLSGTYGDVEIGVGTSFEFDGNDVTVTYSVSDEVIESVSGTYELSGDKITFELNGSISFISSGEYDFSLEEEAIIIDGKEYKKLQ